jgi:hypothetical protein
VHAYLPTGRLENLNRFLKGIVLFLRFLSQGGTMQSLAWEFYVGKSTASKIVYETCQALWTVLSPIYLAEPNEDDWMTIAEGFNQRWNLANCVGAADGKHFNIQASGMQVKKKMTMGVRPGKLVLEVKLLYVALWHSWRNSVYTFTEICIFILGLFERETIIIYCFICYSGTHQQRVKIL